MEKKRIKLNNWKIVRMLENIDLKGEEAKEKAEVVREEHAKCDCCLTKTNNSKSLYLNGYRYPYYIWNDKFLCSKCFERTIKREHPLLTLIFTAIYILAFPLYYVKKNCFIWRLKGIYFVKRIYRKMCRFLELEVIKMN